MESIVFLSFLVGICLIAYLLQIRDMKRAEKLLLEKLKKDYGQAPNRKYKEDDLDHITGYYLKHRREYQIDDITWNDLNMDGVFVRMNYCLSASGEEYLYHMLRTPHYEDDFENMEKKIEFFRNNDETRRRFQVIFSKIGRRIRYSIYDYIDYLGNVEGFSNRKHFVMLGLMLAAGALCFVNFTIGFVALILLMVANIIMYFQVKNEIEPYLATYGYILRVIGATDYFAKENIPELADDVSRLKEAAENLKGFTRGSYILMSPQRMNSGGNPLEMILDYLRMATHIDIIKFNQMYRQIIAHKDDLDDIITITGKLDALISIACFRQSFNADFSVPSFENEGGYKAERIIHPLIPNCVENDVDTQKGLLITGSNASGKSTYLKSCAINAILSQTVHTVLAKNYRAPFFRIFSSMALTDDIFEGDSYYIVEIKSIKRILDAAKQEGAKVLCFVDEVLRGTNTIERIAASTHILKSFSKSGVMCFAATHDIELTTLLADYYGIYHFEGNVSDNDVHFDYLIKEGPATTRNAIKLLGVLGYDNEVVDNAQNLADHFLKNGVWV
jgi:hypothetical protein